MKLTRDDLRIWTARGPVHWVQPTDAQLAEMGLVAVKMSTCRHCGRVIHLTHEGWVDLQATGDDEIWRDTCDEHDTFVADHEPEEERE